MNIGSLFDKHLDAWKKLVMWCRIRQIITKCGELLAFGITGRYKKARGLQNDCCVLFYDIILF